MAFSSWSYLWSQAPLSPEWLRPPPPPPCGRGCDPRTATRPFGTALYEEEGRERSLEVAIARLQIRDASLIVKARGIRLGRLRIEEGEGELELDNTLGDRVPKMREGDRLTVRRRSGKVALSGTF